MRPNGFLIVISMLTFACAGTDSPVDPGGNPPVNPPATISGAIAVAGLDGIKLFVLDSGVIPLTANGRDPSWSPDGKRLVYSTTQCETDWETYYKCDKGGLVFLDVATRVSNTPTAGFIGEHPAWSPQGDEIVFSRLTNVGNRLFIMRADGSPPVELVVTGVNNAYGPSWSPDGRQIAFFGSGGHNGVCVINRDGTGQKCLPYPGISPAWRPDGSVLAVTGANQVVSLMALDGSGVTPLTPGLIPAWSPDGTKLAFVRNNGGVWIADADGSNARIVASGTFGRPAWRPRL